MNGKVREFIVSTKNTYLPQWPGFRGGLSKKNARLLSGLWGSRTWYFSLNVSGDCYLLFIEIKEMWLVDSPPLLCFTFHLGRRIGGVFIEAPLMLFCVRPDVCLSGYVWEMLGLWSEW